LRQENEKKKGKQVLGKIHNEQKWKTLPFFFFFFWFSSYELKMSAHILLHNTSLFLVVLVYSANGQ